MKREKVVQRELIKYAVAIATDETAVILRKAGWKNFDRPTAQEFFSKSLRVEIHKIPMTQIPVVAKKAARTLARATLVQWKKLVNEKQSEMASTIAQREIEMYGRIIVNGQEVLLN